MAEQSRAELKEFSRRTTITRSAAYAAGAVVSLLPIRQAAAKMAPAAVSYQSSPKGDQQCSNCSLFQPPNACQLVDGTIIPSGWCKFWVRKAG